MAPPQHPLRYLYHGFPRDCGNGGQKSYVNGALACKLLKHTTINLKTEVNLFLVPLVFGWRFIEGTRLEKLRQPLQQICILTNISNLIVEHF